MPRFLTLLCAVAALVPAGCIDYYVYEIRMEPKDAGVERTVTVRHVTGKSSPQPENATAKKRLPDEDLERLTALYSERLTKDADETETFRGTFADKLPADVGGAGNYRKIDTPLGSAYWYTERFRGADDLDAELFARRAAADRLADLTVGWFDEQMKDSPHHGAVRKFLHQDFRQDLRNVVTHLWNSYRPAAPTKEKKGDSQLQPFPEPFVGAVSYLVEKGYFDPDGAASLARYQADDGVQLREIRRLLARKSGLPAAEADRIFSFLVDRESVRLSLSAYLKKTPEYESLRKSWKPDPGKPEITEPDSLEVLGVLAKQACDLEFIMARDELHLTLVVPVKPYLTNGTYDPNEGAVTWHADLPTRREMPYVCLAAWVVPDEKAQTGSFGKIRLDGDNLATFAVLYSGLSAERRKEFAAYVEKAKRGETPPAASIRSPFSEPIDEATRQFEAQAATLLK